MSHSYFSEREFGPRAQEDLQFSAAAWGGVIALINGLIDRGAFGIDYPEQCPDGEAPIGTDRRLFWLALNAEVPELGGQMDEKEVPAAAVAMDVLEFCFLHVSEPVQRGYHGYFGHYHLSFNREEGRRQFLEAANRLLTRSGLAYQMTKAGTAQRLGPPVLRESLLGAVFSTGDEHLNAMLEAARRRFLSPDPQDRVESLEKLWDAWERLKTLGPGRDKKDSITNLLNVAASEGPLRSSLEAEAKELTVLGNTLQIRHSEKDKVPVTCDEHVDYLFHRLFALIRLLVGALGT